ncbi:MAG TPA: hypothetical protein VNP04_13605 [Alphaproteobacteria bacterium]|nr:hypothetical protein [Alphaproteobacteria bacterium]
MAYSAGNISNLDLGPCAVYFGESGSEVNMGFTKGGVRISVESPVVNLTTDQFGQVIMKQVLVGRTAMVTVPFAESKVSLFATIIPGASAVTDAVSSESQKVIINTPIGKDLVTIAKSLRLVKAIGNTESSDPNDVFRFFKAGPTGRIEFSFDLENQRVYSVEFFAYPDSTQDFALGVWGDINAN